MTDEDRIATLEKLLEKLLSDVKLMWLFMSGLCVLIAMSIVVNLMMK